jgi:hypothetical protein
MAVITLKELEKQFKKSKKQQHLINHIIDQLSAAEWIREQPSRIFEDGDSAVLRSVADKLEGCQGSDREIKTVSRLSKLAESLRR